MAGSDVMVLVSEKGDCRPVEILGALGGDLQVALGTRVHGPRPHTLAVGAELYDADLRVRRLVQLILENGLTEVRFFGENWPADLDDDIERMSHRLSVAARAFKTQALAAAAAPVEPVETTEVFVSGEVLSLAPETPHLVPV
ncbi:hypothetical protein ABZ863_18150 [Saccharomonospora sp. NPDC046836]|uniref:hypothetical protein n=1 Tax=Saccharomonospora sp. NPDC046836 TaxID=3156921 RepID=UPI00340D5DF9